MTWRDFSIYTIAWERNELNEWLRTRKLAHMIYSTVATREKWQPENVWWKMLTDEVEETAPPSQDEIQRMINWLQQPQENKA